MQMKAYNAAMDIYVYGKHVAGTDGAISLAYLATTSDRAVVPQFDVFKRYYESSKYADTIIRSALTGADPTLTADQRHAIVIRSAQVLVMYFGVLQAVYDAVSSCNNGNLASPTGVGLSWDKAAAYYIGSLEGTQSGGSKDGYMLYNLAQENCLLFGTCTDPLKDVGVNEHVISLLYSGRGAVLAKSCGALSKAAGELSSMILVPIIQATLNASLLISGTSDPNPEVTLVEGYVYAQGLLPLADEARRESATTLSTDLSLKGPPVKRNVAKDVFAALAYIYPRWGVECVDVGMAGGFDACTGVPTSAGLDTLAIALIAAASAFVCFACICCVYFRTKKRKRRKLPENNPTFVPQEGGELNHSMDLLQKAFTGAKRTGSETDRLTSSHIDASPTVDEDFEDLPALESRRESAPDII